jgi:hypothetical protein
MIRRAGLRDGTGQPGPLTQAVPRPVP